jgi:hypothetical protein
MDFRSQIAGDIMARLQRDSRVNRSQGRSVDGHQYVVLLGEQSSSDLDCCRLRYQSLRLMS